MMNLIDKIFDFKNNIRMRKILCFIMVGGAAFVIDAGITQYNVWFFGWNPMVSRLPGFMCAVIFSWLFNRWLTFQARKPVSVKEFVLYVSMTSVTMVINLSIYAGLVLVVPLCYDFPVFALGAATSVTTVFNFVAYAHILK